MKNKLIIQNHTPHDLQPVEESTNWAVACPDCHSALQYNPGYYVCLQCKKSYPVEGGVICFTQADSFYEDRYKPISLQFLPNEHRPWGLALLYLVSMHYFWYIRKYISPRARVLDLACGAGMRILAQHYHTAGLEVSLSSAYEMAKIYDLALRADAMHIPFQDDSVNAIVSRFFFEHVPFEDKHGLLSECRRVLKPGGWLITLQDCECNNSLWRWAKRDPVLFQKLFIENDGHYGLIYASENLKLFEQAGFEVIAYQGMNKTPWVSLSMLEWMQPYRHKSPFGALLRLAPPVNRSRYLNAAYTLSMTLWDDLVEKWLPLDHSRYLLAACRRKD